MIRSVIRYLFPKTRLQDKLPLLPRGFTSDNAPQARADDSDARYIMGRSAARSEADAHRLLMKHKANTARQVAREKRRERKRESRWHRAWRKFKELLL